MTLPCSIPRLLVNMRYQRLYKRKLDPVRLIVKSFNGKHGGRFLQLIKQGNLASAPHHLAPGMR